MLMRQVQSDLLTRVGCTGVRFLNRPFNNVLSSHYKIIYRASYSNHPRDGVKRYFGMCALQSRAHLVCPTKLDTALVSVASG